MTDDLVLQNGVLKNPWDAANTPVTARLTAISEQVTLAQFTDGGSAAGTYQMQESIPAGAVVLAAKATVEEGFAGDTSAVLTIGDGSDVDRYMTGTPSVFATAANGIQLGVPSGSLLLTAANRPTLTVTSGSDFGLVTDGILTVTIFYVEAV